MQLLKAIITDDEEHCINILSSLLARYCPQVQIVATCNNISDTVKAVQLNEPTLIFLDVEMPDGDGFKLFDFIKSPKFKVIFTTAHEKYALKAIRFSALDYLLKPIDPDDLIEAVSKAENAIFGVHMQEQLETLVYNISNFNGDKKIVLPVSNGFEFLKLSDVYYCKADNNYTIFYLANKTKVIVSKTLGEYEDLLSDYHFFRIHQSHIINLKYLKSYNKGDGGHVVLTDNTELEVSRRKKEEFFKRIQSL